MPTPVELTMQTKHLNIFMYLVIGAIGAITIQQTTYLPEPMAPDVGPGFLPVALAWFMIVLCAIGLIQTFVQTNRERLQFPGLSKIIVTSVSVAVFFWLWESYGYFYVLSTILLAGLLIYYSSDEVMTRKLVAACVVGSVVSNVVIYVFFTYVLYTKF